MTGIGAIKELIRRVMPSRYGWSGDHPSWEAAEKRCSGYAADKILEKVRQSALRVKAGEYPYERDSVLFDRIGYSWPLLAGLMWVAARQGGRLKVADFGGSLGSTYFQNRAFLEGLNEVTWDIIEQPNFVIAGREYIEDGGLRFFDSLEKSTAQTGKPDVLLLSCVLPYISEPYLLIGQLMEHRIPYLVIDNTYFNYEGRDRITIQKVPPSIYEASYPCWFLDYERVKRHLEREYRIVAEYENDSFIFFDRRKIQYRGLLLKRSDHEDHS